MATTEQERDYPDLAVPRRTADYADPGVGWTAQHYEREGVAPEDRIYAGNAGYNPNTQFHPTQLPDPDAAVAAGLLPQGIPDALVNEDYEHQSPLTELDPEDSLRDRGREAAAERDALTNPDQGDIAYERAKAQVERGSAPARSSKRQKPKAAETSASS